MAKESDYRLGSDDPVLIVELSITSWCNYTCAYCVTTVQQRRGDSLHAFDRHPVSAWLAAFERIPFEISLLCRGGEPFLDHESFAPFLTGMGTSAKVRYVRVDTNGSWSPDRYASVPVDVRRKTQLNMSFHPTQIGLEVFSKRLGKIIAAGWHVAMVNYVMESHQADDYERVRDFLEKEHGVYVNPNPDAFEAFDPDRVILPGRRSAQDPLRKLLPVIDAARKSGEPTSRKSCFFPSIGYFVSPDGTAERACGFVVPGQPRRFDFIRDSATIQPLARAVSCPQPVCACLDRYAFLEETESRGREIDLLNEYVRDCRAHQLASR